MAAATVTYLLNINGKPHSGHRTVESAKVAAERFYQEKSDLVIACPNAPAPTSVLRYDYDVKDWVVSG